MTPGDITSYEKGGGGEMCFQPKRDNAEMKCAMHSFLLSWINVERHYLILLIFL